MSDSMINTNILKKIGGELEHSINCRCVEPCSMEEYINSIKDIITRTRIGKNWTRTRMESKIVQTSSREDKIPVLSFQKCGRTSHLANTCTKKTKTNEAQVIQELQCDGDKEVSDQDFVIS
ncbi:hypothetical protein O181_002700 [Austropuccinia psidii MF-1]|uniref:Uncharacterized protein n=1 Tax=Austropuccinia psidii MF-1 TaxID=1389203 RepID=A0A9Q3GD42_9BASI|nr:hypothetical protein [Austropuccinia psidii MF-1]